MYKSKWGFYPCDFETYKKLKLVYKEYWRGLMLLARLKRWENKLPKNRVGVKPTCADVYGKICKSDIVTVFRQARTPMSDEKEVKPISSKFIFAVDSWVEELK